MNEQKTLLDCPFCGGNTLETYEIWKNQDRLYPGIYIRCQDCGACGPRFERQTDDKHVVGAWNMRQEDKSKMLSDIIGEIDNRIEVDEDGITIHPTPGYDYFIEWNRLSTKNELISWLYHISSKIWLDRKIIRNLIRFACSHRGWNYQLR